MKKLKNSRSINRFVLAVSAILLVLIVLVSININFLEKKEITSFQECLESGYLIEESYPRQCRTLEGVLFLENLTIKESCISWGGRFLEDHNECESISEQQCSLLNGSFNECASSCRHNQDAEVCIQVCVPLCVLNA